MFDITKPMFPAEAQLSVIRENQDFIVLMKTAKDVKHWNRLREFVKAKLQPINPVGYIMLMGHVDGVIFPQLFGR